MRRSENRLQQLRFIVDEKGKLRLPNNSRGEVQPPTERTKSEAISYLFEKGKTIWVYSRSGKKIAVTVISSEFVAYSTSNFDQQGRREFQVAYPATIKWPSGKSWQMHSGDVFWAKPADAKKQVGYQPPQPAR